jgi:hypothetical protein
MQNIINIIVITILIYILFRLPTVEKMSNIDKATEDKIREIYKIDTDAIRNLSNLAKDLTVGGKLTVPGGLDVKDTVKLGPSAWDRHLVLGGKNREAVKGEQAHIHSTNGNLHIDSQNERDIYLNHYTKKPVIIGNEIIFNTTPKTPDGKLKISNNGIMFGGNNNNKKEVNSAQISAGLHVPNSLNIVGMSDDNKANRKVDMFAEGGFKVNGRNILAEIDEIKKNYVKKIVARYIRIGNTDMPYWHDAWTIIEAEVYNNNNVNVARGKTVKFIKGSAQLGTSAGNVVNGKIFNGRGQLHDNWSNGIHGVNGHHEIEIDLGKEQVIDHIILYNRWSDGSDWRMDGTHIKCYDSAKRLLKTINTGLWHRQYSKTFTL